jgi:hypothetical protein
MEGLGNNGSEKDKWVRAYPVNFLFFAKELLVAPFFSSSLAGLGIALELPYK